VEVTIGSRVVPVSQLVRRSQINLVDLPALRTAFVLGVFLIQLACTEQTPSGSLVFAGSAIGREGEMLRHQFTAFEAQHPDLHVEIRSVPDAADQQHQLYVQWLNAHAPEPDVLQLDAIATPEFAAAGWVLPLDAFHPATNEFFAATIAANRWKGSLFALPWFVDVGMLYWRTDLLDAAPSTFDELSTAVSRAQRDHGLPFGFVWSGARYEGLVTVFLEYLNGFGGRFLDEAGRVVVDSDAGIRALTALGDTIYRDRTSPPDVLAWQEEQTRFAFQSGRAVAMRNWPYAYPLLADPAASRVAGRFAVGLMPHAAGGTSVATLGGQQLAINARSRHPAAAYALVKHLTSPEQMLERARIAGEYPARPALYDRREMAALGAPPDQIRRIIEHAVPRPVTPVYAELSELLQVHLHRALTRQQEPGAALHSAAAEMNDLLVRTGLLSS
jgi:ABC-type glycerol-3-phosphate transport system substrate-binding protein